MYRDFDNETQWGKYMWIMPCNTVCDIGRGDIISGINSFLYFLLLIKYSEIVLSAYVYGFLEIS
jgi:hypothetical protein